MSEKRVRRDSGMGIYVRYSYSLSRCRSKNVSEERVRRDSGMGNLIGTYTHCLDVGVRT